MVLIECFTSSHVDNIAACLRLRPEKLVMVGDGEAMVQPLNRYKDFLQARGLKTQITPCPVGNKDLGDICALLGKLVRQAEECVIDLTGGDELVIMAVGAMLAGLDKKERQRVRVEKYDHRENLVKDCVNDNRPLDYKPISLTVEELIFLHGGGIHEGSYQPSKNSHSRDIQSLWKVVCQAPKDWNQRIGLLNEFERGLQQEQHIRLEVGQLRQRISNFDKKETAIRDLLKELDDNGVIRDRSSRDVIDYRYTTPLLRYCTAKAGNALEVKTLLEGRRVPDNGVPFFADCQMGVHIDWDNNIHKPYEQVSDTENEVDGIFIRGTTPLFVSCKNGNIGDDELHKLNTVAQHFGGPYARKMLIATDLDRKSASSDRAFAQRAWDMDIFLVTDAAQLSDEEWADVFRQAIL